MHHAPILVHGISPAGGRRVSLRAEGRDTVLGLARSDADVIEFLRRAGVPDPDEMVLGDSPLVEWMVDDPHAYEAEPSDTDIP
ncbi:hypothetical protein SUDANB120_00681 [Streptomyces sp. enrichment culture]|uniref:hypothetical protein n=1 Tax=Streptomyces TaxID=1883 RepID=UPI00167583AE|nr:MULTISPECIES: hypothetical protein [Streptomyces]MBD3576965.1 hypothetical protein [Streptomyces sp. KD18]GGT04845.1 hypothetical protein GCM10010286_32510 [Streptomyces toxytricini]